MPDSRIRQHVRYATASDGARLAWAEAGSGPLLVKAANWLTHLEWEWQSPVWKHWLQFFSSHCRFVRYDERGCGMSAWQGGALSLDQWADDLGTIIDAAQAGPTQAARWSGAGRFVAPSMLWSMARSNLRKGPPKPPKRRCRASKFQ